MHAIPQKGCMLFVERVHAFSKKGACYFRKAYTLFDTPARKDKKTHFTGKLRALIFQCLRLPPTVTIYQPIKTIDWIFCCNEKKGSTFVEETKKNSNQLIENEYGNDYQFSDS